MSTPPWQLEGSQARLRVDALGATLDLARPDDGLRQFSIGDLLLENMHAMALQLPSSAAADARQPLSEGYVRGDDLTAVYHESPGWPVQVDALWRAIRPSAGQTLLAAVDLIVSVRTGLLSSRPGMAVCTAAPGEEAFRLADLSGPQYDRPDLTPGGAVAIEPAAGPGCLVFRITSTVSYVEMIHPADFHRDQLRAAPRGGSLEWRHRLFPETLEKGVILRARVRGVFLPRQDDLASAAAHYAAFAAAEPPL